ncbi:Cobalt-zinc-cadmium resistance protein [Lacticaseibacillus paracasei]|nr:Cobalt-zinc-cadmium resistance protein [Lacticaseibacillus paracasei]
MDAGRNILKDEQRRFARLKSAQHAAALNLIVYGGLPWQNCGSRS